MRTFTLGALVASSVLSSALAATAALLVCSAQGRALRDGREACPGTIGGLESCRDSLAAHGRVLGSWAREVRESRSEVAKMRSAYAMCAESRSRIDALLQAERAAARAAARD